MNQLKEKDSDLWFVKINFPTALTGQSTNEDQVKKFGLHRILFDKSCLQRILFHKKSGLWRIRHNRHNPSLGRDDCDSGEQTTNLDKTKSPSKVSMCGVSIQQWPNTQITLFERTSQSAWLDAVTTPLIRSEWILLYKNTSFWRELSNPK